MEEKEHNATAAPMPANPGSLPSLASDLSRGPSPSQVDALARSATKDRAIDDASLVVMAGFHWLSSAAVTQLATLKDDIKAKDEPPWVEQLAEAALEVALHAGLAGAAEYVAGRLFDHAADNAVNEGKHEFVKALFEEGIGEGISTCRSTARKPTKDGVLTRFIGAQAAGIQATHQKNQTEWINKGRHSVTTVDEASALALACSPANVEAAAMKQYDASRDAWISYLAQSKYGAVPRGDGSLEQDEHNTATNMSTQESRDRTNRSAPDFVPSRAPHVGDALFGHAPGLLAVVAELPEIRDGYMDGSPRVTMAFLNGVNADIRNQYANRPMAELQIPRHIEAHVAGAMPNFTINVDESGVVTPPRHAESAWLRARAVAAHPEHGGLDHSTQRMLGEQQLLHELVADEIKGKM